MEKLKKGWLCLKFKKSFLVSMKNIILKLTSRITRKAEENRKGLVNLYKDMEVHGGYADIQVMWEMIHSSSSSSSYPSITPITKITSIPH